MANILRILTLTVKGLGRNRENNRDVIKQGQSGYNIFYKKLIKQKNVLMNLH